MKESLLDVLKKYLENLTPEKIEELKKSFPEDTTPKGWVSIEEHLPMFYASDILQGYSIYKVRYSDGSEGDSPVSDHNTWYHKAKEQGITHWLNN